MKKHILTLILCLISFIGFSQIPSFKSKSELLIVLKGRWNFQAGESDSVTHIYHRTNYGQAYVNFVDTTFYELSCPLSGSQMHKMTTCKEKWSFSDNNILSLHRGPKTWSFRIEKLNAFELSLTLISSTQ